MLKSNITDNERILKIVKIINQNKYKIIAIILSAFLIRFFYLFYTFNFKYKSSENASKMVVQVIRNDIKQVDKVGYIVKYNGDMFLLNIYKDKYDKNKEKEDISKIYGEFKYGEKLKLRGKIVIPKKLGNPHEFDYKRYLNSLNVVGCISTYEVVESDAKTSGNNIFLGLSYFLREDIGKKVEEKMPEKEASLFKSMIYGDDRQLDSSIRQDFKNIGISHLLAVSGSNIASVVLITTFLFKRFNKKVVLILNILTVCIFCVISGLEISVIRAGIMTLLTFVFTIFEIKASSYTKIFISFICIFIYNPYAIFNVRMCFILSCNYWNISVFPYYT